MKACPEESSSHQIVEEGTFKQLHELYKVHGLQPGTNHCWLALYFMAGPTLVFASLTVQIAALTTKLTDKAAYLFPNYSAEQLSRIPNALYQASVDALESANYMAVPQIRHIQVSHVVHSLPNCQVALLYVLFLVVRDSIAMPQLTVSISARLPTNRTSLCATSTLQSALHSGSSSTVSVTTLQCCPQMIPPSQA